MDGVSVVEEHPDYYVLEKDGEQFEALKIKKDVVQKIQDESNRKVAEKLTKDDMYQLLSTLTDIMNDIPTVETFEFVTNKLADYLQVLYDKVGRPNLFHHPIKNLHTECYGKAQTFMKEVLQLYETAIEIAEMMKEMGKLSEVETAQIPYKKYTIQFNGEGSTYFTSDLVQLSEKHRDEGKDVKLRQQAIHRTFTKIA